MGVQYSFCKSLSEQPQLSSDCLPPESRQWHSRRILDSWWKADSARTGLIKRRQQWLRLTLAFWFSCSKYVTKCGTEGVRKISDCWTRRKKLLQVCPVYELWHKTSRFEKVPGVKDFSRPGSFAASGTTGREMDPVLFFFQPSFVQWITLLFCFFLLGLFTKQNPKKQTKTLFLCTNTTC